MPLTHDQVLQYVREKGPSVPNAIRQALQAQDNFIVGAVLSELVGSGKLAMSDLSLGTSRFYYDPSNPASLESISQYLNEKDLKTYQLLRQEKVLRHSEVTPLLRLSLGNIKDYSRPVRVRTESGEELFWHYYLITAEEAFEIIKQKYFHEPEAPPAPEPATPAEKTRPRERKAEKPAPSGQPVSSDFSKLVHEYFDEKEVAVLQVIASKKTELSLIVSMPTPIGPVKYFCKAKAKKTTNEGDLAAAHLEAQQHRLPLLFVSGGKLTKKATDMLQQLPGIVAVQPWA